jgi:peptidoglycan hydrolase CwlO-like protein
MRRTPRALASLGFLLATAFYTPGGLAAAEPSSPESIGSLVAAIANVNQKLQELGAAVQAQQEGVNKAIVDVQAARDNAAAAQQDVDASRHAVDDSTAAITSAQKRFDTFAASTYVNGPSSSYLTAADPADIIDTASAGQTLSTSAQQVVANLQKARTEQVNEESAARLAKEKADQATVDAQSSQDAAVSALKSAQQTFADQQGQLNELTAERTAAQAKLARARAWSAPATGQAKPVDKLGPCAGNPFTRCGQLGPESVGSDAARDPERLRQRRPDRHHQLGARHVVDLGAVHRRHGPELSAQDGHFADADRIHQRRDSARLRQAGLRVRHQACRKPAGGAVLVGRWQRRGGEHRHRFRF